MARAMGLPSLVTGVRHAMYSLSRDIEAARERDPAARSLAEVMLCYPGLHRHRDPPGREDRAGPVHRPRDGRRDR
jgi:hypothetical protein